MATAKTIVFFHPDLGIGGAERLVVDAAVGLQRLGYCVVIFTNHCDPTHCFDECRDGTLDIRVRARTIPPSLHARLTILLTTLRHTHLLLSTMRETAALRPTAFFVDQLSAGLPLLRVLHPRTPILFYCHYPDLLLAARASRIKRLYRVPFDALEEWSMRFAHAVAVNSEFTRGVVRRTWPSLARDMPLQVVYPCVDVGEDEEGEDEGGGEMKGDGEMDKGEEKGGDMGEGDMEKDGKEEDMFKGLGKVLLSINRFERKKNIGLAIRAFAAIPEPERRNAHLILAGGYDARIAENASYLTALQTLARSLSLPFETCFLNASTSSSTQPSTSSSTSPSSPSTTSTSPSTSPSTPLIFLPSIPTTTKHRLLRHCTCVIYTPANEHFGIVPLEAMHARRPVLAANSGGPVESVRPESGWLCDPDDVEAWTRVMRTALHMPPHQLARMGERGAQRVRDEFSRDRMAQRLHCIFERLQSSSSQHIHSAGGVSALLMLLAVLVAGVAGLVATLLLWLTRA